jgi:hypothetical protein
VLSFQKGRLLLPPTTTHPFFRSIAGGPAQAAPVVLLLTSLVGTAYVTVVVHRYLAVLAAGALQVAFAFLAPSSSSSYRSRPSSSPAF